MSAQFTAALAQLSSKDQEITQYIIVFVYKTCH